MERMTKAELIKAFSHKTLLIKAVGDGYIKTTRKELLGYINRCGLNVFNVTIATRTDSDHKWLYIVDAGGGAKSID